MATITDANESAIVPLGGALSVKETEEGVFELALIEAPPTLPKVVNGDDRKDFTFTFGPVKVVGYVVLSTFEIGVEVYIFGVKGPSVYGNLRQGIVIKVNAFLEKGQLRFYLQGKDVMLEIKLTGVAPFDKTVKIITV